MGSIYWVYWLALVPSGIIGKKYGSKITLTLAMLLSSMVCFLMPIAAYIDYRIMIFLRILQGVFAVSIGIFTDLLYMRLLIVSL